MTPREYLELVCIPNLDDFIQHPTSFRHAWAATVSLFHFRDYLAADRLEPVGAIASEIERDFPPFKAVADIANASKHFTLDRGTRLGLSATNLKIGRGAAFSDGSYYSDGTSHSDAPDVVRVEFNGEYIDVLHLCRSYLTVLKMKV